MTEPATKKRSRSSDPLPEPPKFEPKAEDYIRYGRLLLAEAKLSSEELALFDPVWIGMHKDSDSETLLALDKIPTRVLDACSLEIIDKDKLLSTFGMGCQSTDTKESPAFARFKSRACGKIISFGCKRSTSIMPDVLGKSSQMYYTAHRPRSSASAALWYVGNLINTQQANGISDAELIASIKAVYNSNVESELAMARKYEDHLGSLVGLSRATSDREYRY